VADNGRGLGPEDLAKARSFGIRGLRERSGTVGGWVDLSSGSGGTTLILSIPLDGQAVDDEDPGAPDPGLFGEAGHDPSAWGEP
jgi:signal transduction histidine kinase